MSFAAHKISRKPQITLARLRKKTTRKTILLRNLFKGPDKMYNNDGTGTKKIIFIKKMTWLSH